MDIEHDGRKCNDAFVWNIRGKSIDIRLAGTLADDMCIPTDTLISPSLFATILCEDLLLPTDFFHAAIINSINDQIKQYQEAEDLHPRTLFIGSQTQPTSSSAQYPDNTDNAISTSAVGLAQDERISDAHLPCGGVTSNQEEEEWWNIWRKKVKLATEVELGQEMQDVGWSEGDEPEIPPVGPFTEAGANSALQSVSSAEAGKTNDELRVLIRLDISVDTVNLRDQFEWDLSDPQNQPEDFAYQLCADLGLPGEFLTAISHSIREQVDAHARSLSSVRHIRGDQILHDELRPCFQLQLTEPIRSNDVESWTPHLEKLGLAELDQREKERERQSRRQKRGARNNRRNVVTLPDREPLRTNRTLMPRPGAGLDVSDASHGGEDGFPVATYEVALPYPLIPPQDRGPAPQMSSPLRRHARPKIDIPPMFLNGDLSATLPGKPKVVGKKRGRPPNDPTAFAASAGIGNPLDAANPQVSLSLLSGSASASGSPVGVPSPIGKRGPGRPWKGKSGWNRPEMTTHPNIIDEKWHCTSKLPSFMLSIGIKAC